MKNKILLIVLMFFLVFSFKLYSQEYVSQDLTNPTIIQNINTEQLFFYEHQTISVMTPSIIARDYLGKDFYLSFTCATSGAFKIITSFQHPTYAGISLYKNINGELVEVAYEQNMKLVLSLYVSEGLFEEGEAIFTRLWINEEIAGGAFTIKSLPVVLENRDIGTPPQINTTSFTPEQLVTQILTSGCVEALNVEYSGSLNSIGYFSSGIPGLDFEEGVVMSTGRADQVDGPNDSDNQTGDMHGSGDDDLDDVIGGHTRDAAVLEFDFIPSTDHVEFQYVFGSEEYEEYVGSNFNDVFAFFVSGGPENYNNQNIALIPGTSTPVSINNVNQNLNTSYYENNDEGPYLQFDGNTVTLIAQADVTACQTYHMKLAIADVSDRSYDSGVFLKAGSFISGTSVVMKNFNAWGYLNSIHEGCTNQLIFSRSDTSNINEAMDVDITISGNATVVDDYTTINAHYEIPAGEEYISIDYDAIVDGFADDNEYIVISIYNGCPCSVQVSTDSIRIDDEIEFVASIQNPGQVCYGDSILLSVNMSPLPDTAIVTWSNGMTSTDIYVSPLVNTSYDVTIEYPCDSKILSTSVEVLPLPTPVASNSGAYCEGDDIELNVSNSYIYRWKGPNEFVSTLQDPVIPEAGLIYSGNYFVTVTDSYGCKAITNTEVTVNPNPVPDIAGPFVLCENDTLILDAGNYDTYQWVGADGFTSSLPNPYIFPLSLDNSGLYQVLVLDENLCRGSDTATITVFPTPIPVVSITSPVCVGDTVFLEASGGISYEWEGPNAFSSSNSQENIPNIEIIDAGTYYVTVFENGCFAETSAELVVDTMPDATITSISDFCEVEEDIVLQAISPGGTWSGTGIVDANSGAFSPSITGVGTFVINYFVENGNCVDIDSIQVSVDEALDPTIDSVSSFCDSDSPVILTATNSGVWSGTGITNINGTFNPALADEGSNIIYNTTINGACVLADSIEIFVYADVDASITPVGVFCEYDSPQNLIAATQGGTWSGVGITDALNGTFNPENAGDGDHFVYYEVGNGACYDIDSLLIHVDAIPDASILPVDAFCISNSPQDLTSVNSGGTWSGNGITNTSAGTFSPAIAGVGTHTISYSIINGTCTDTDEVEVIVNDAVDATIGAAGPFCIVDGEVSLSVIDGGGEWNGNGITDQVAGTFSPSFAGAGDHTISYIIQNGACSDSDTLVIHVDSYPSILVSSVAPLCENEAPFNLVGTPLGGTWSGTGITDTSNGTFDPDISSYGVFTITYSVVNGACSASDNIDIHVDENIIPIISPDGPWCENDIAVTLTSNYAGGTWSGTGVTDQSAGIFNPQISGCGDFTINYVLENGTCSNTDSFVFHIDCIPDASILPVVDICETNIPITLVANSAGGIWSGLGVFGDQFDSSVTGSGDFYVYYTLNSGVCQSTDSTLVHVDSFVDATIVNSGPYCETGVSSLLSANSLGGIWSGTGIVNSNTGLFDPFVAGVGSQVISYDVINGACNDSDTQTIIVESQPDASITNVGPYCITDATVTLNAISMGGTWSGNGIIDTGNGLFDPAVAGQGNHTISYAIINGSCNDSDQITIHVDDDVEATITPAGPFCIDEIATILLAVDSGGEWTGPGIVNTTTGLFEPAFAGEGTHTIQYYIENGACSDTDTETFVVDNITNPVITPVGEICESDGAITLIGNPVGGIWAGTGIIDTNNGVFDPTVSGDGTFTVTYTIINGACSNQTSINIIVDAAVDASIITSGPFCQFDPTVNFSAVSGGGTWSGNGITNVVSGEFSPAVAGVGVHAITYNVVNGTCSDMNTVNIVVDLAFDATVTAPGPICITDAIFNMTAATVGGVWSGNGIIDASLGTFDPAIAGAGAHQISYSISNGSCNSTDQITVYVYNTVVDATITSVETLCVTSGEIILTAATAGGTWIGPGITDAVNGVFNPEIAGAGTHTINYSVGNIACYDAANTTIQIDDTLPATISLVGPYCESNADVSLSAASSGGTWSGTGIIDASNGLFSPSLASEGIHNITFSIVNGVCTNTDNIDIQIDGDVSADITPDGSFCVNESSIILHAISSGGLWSGNGITNTSSGTFSPAIAGVGTHVISYNVVNGECNDTDTESFVVDAIPNTTITSAGPYCETSSAVNLNAATLSGTWSGIGITDPLAGIFDPAIAGSGDHSILYSLTQGACTNSSSVVIHVDEFVDATITLAGPFCETEASVVLDAVSIGGTWSGIGIINASQGIFHPGIATGGDHNISYTVSNGECTDSDNILITVYSDPDPQISPAGPFCETQTPLNLNANIIGGIWSGNGITDATAGTFDPSVAMPGDHLITYTVGNGTCIAETNISIHVDEFLDASISPSGPFCINNGLVTLTAADNGGMWSGAGIVNSSTGIFNPIVAGAGDHLINYLITNGACSDNDNITIHIDSELDPTIVGTYTFCEDDTPVNLNSVTSGGIWSGDGIQDVNSGLFDPSIALEGSHTIIYTVTNGECITQDNTIITVSGIVDATITNSGPYCETQASVTLYAADFGGEWSGTGIIDSDNGGFSPAVAQDGSHSITYTIVNGYCSDTDTELIIVDAFPDPTIADMGDFCINTMPVTLSAATLGGIWSGNGILDENSGLFDPSIAGTGIHTITYRISNGVCNAEDNISITVNDTTFLEFISLDNSMCLNEAAQEITLNISGGNLSGNGIIGTQFLPSNAGVGVHVITYTFSNGFACSSEVSESITVNDLPYSNFLGLDSDYCLNDMESELTGIPAGGVFEGEGISSNFFNPTSAGVGSYTIIYHFTDSNMCTDTASVDVEIHSIPEITIDAINTPSCNGLNNGSIYISVNSGTPEYLYLWTGGTTSVNQDVLALSADMYYIEVTDAQGCVVNESVDLVEPDALVLSLSLVNNASCNAYADGSVMGELTGGTLEYSYDWDYDDADGNLSPDNLPAGTFTLTVTDQNNCIITESITVAEPDPVNLVIEDISHVSCFGYADGTVTINANGGTSPFNYQWQDPPGGTNNSVTGLEAGIYSVTIIDDNACESEHEVEITSPDEIAFDANITNVNCGNSLGIISVSVSGGTIPYSYEWSDAGSTSNVNFGLIAGDYSLTVIDDNTCTHQETFRIDPEGTNQVLISQIGDIACNGDNTAVLMGSMPQGDPNFSYLWSNGITSSVNDELVAGNYSLTIIDGWGCSGTESYLVTEPTIINALINTTPVNCYGNATGSAILNVSGGSVPYSILWSNEANSFQIENLVAQTYYVTITDNNGCEVVESCIISQPDAPLIVDFDIVPISCYGDTDGVINGDGSGGTPPYQYHWFVNDHFVSTQNIRDLGQGSYYLTLTDTRNCLADTSVFLTQPLPLQAESFISNPSCIGNYDGSIDFDISGGTEPYYYDLASNVYYVLPIESLYQGVYTVTIIDDHGCELVFEELQLEDTDVHCLTIPNAFTPNGDGVNDIWEIDNVALFPQAYIKVFNRWGQILYEGLAAEGFWDGTYNQSPVPTGTYLYIITLYNGPESYSGVVTVVR